MTDTELKPLIKAALESSGSPDPHTIARELYTALSDAQKEQLVVEGLAKRISFMVSVDRSETGLVPTKVSSSKSRVGQSKWQRNVRYTQRVHVDGVWKFLGQCSITEVEWLAEQRERESERLLAVADEFRKLARQMYKHGAKTVDDLPDLANFDTEDLTA